MSATQITWDVTRHEKGFQPRLHANDVTTHLEPRATYSAARRAAKVYKKLTLTQKSRSNPAA